jgi:hypothetical protein
MTTSITVNERALFARVNRALAKEGERLHRAREGTRAYNDVGRYYVVDLQTNSIAAKDCDLEALAKDMKLLAEWEKLAADD